MIFIIGFSLIFNICQSICKSFSLSEPLKGTWDLLLCECTLKHLSNKPREQGNCHILQVCVCMCVVKDVVAYLGRIELQYARKAIRKSLDYSYS